MEEVKPLVKIICHVDPSKVQKQIEEFKKIHNVLRTTQESPTLAFVLYTEDAPVQKFEEDVAAEEFKIDLGVPTCRKRRN